MKLRLIVQTSIILILSLIQPLLFGQDCNVLSKANDIHPDKYCAPVSADWKITYRGVMNVSKNSDVEFVFDWGDGTIETIPFGAGPGKVHNIGGKDFEATMNHIYPDGLTGTCNYTPQVWLQLKGVLCSSSVQEQNVTVWDVDNANGGVLTIEEPVVYVCVGSDTTVVFRDVSQWNCVPPQENDHQNNLSRWTQWEYGTGGTTLTNVFVGGNKFINQFDGNVELMNGPVVNPTNPGATARAIYVPAPSAADVGKRFYVTLNNWNYCNQYPGNDPVNRTAYIEVVDIPHPSITFKDPSDAELCYGETITLNGSPAGGIWTTENGKGFDNPNVGQFKSNKAGTGKHTITYTYVGNGDCVGTAEIEITVFPRPKITTNITDEVYLCPGTQFDFINKVTSGTAPFDYTWSRDTDPLDAKNILNPRFYTETPGLYTLKLNVKDLHLCAASKTLKFTISDVNIRFDKDTLVLCQGENNKLNFKVSGGSGNYTYSWEGDTKYLSGPQESPSFDAKDNGMYKLICKVVDDGNCEFVDSVVLKVTQMPSPKIKGGDRSVCGFYTQLGAGDGLGVPIWQAKNNTANISIKAINDTIAEVLVNKPGVYEIERIEMNEGCVASTSVKITFIEMPKPFAGVDVNVCKQDYVLQGVPSVGSGVWALADGPGTLTFDDQFRDTTKIISGAAGVYNLVWQEDNAGCVARDTVTITFNPLPVADFDALHIGNCSPLNVDFVNKSTNSDFYIWTFEDGALSNQEDPSYSFTVPLMDDSVYTVQLEVRSSAGCEDVVTKDITVFPRPIAKLRTNYVPACSPALVTFENQSVGAAKYLWEYGDGVSDFRLDNNEVSHSYVNMNDSNQIKSFYVNLQAENTFGCVDSSNTYLMVYPEANFDFIFGGNPICESSSVMVAATVGGKLYNWDFGNGKTLVGSSPMVWTSYANTGTKDTLFSVSLNATSFFGCTDTFVDDLIVHPEVIADFILDTYEGSGALDVSLFDQSKNGDNFIIHWGDGGHDTISSIASFPVPHQFVNSEFFPKVFNVMYEVISVDGCRDSVRKQVKVFPGFVVDFEDIDPTCSPLAIRFENLSSPGGSYRWDFGDGSATEKTLFPLHEFKSIGNDDLPDTFIVTLSGTSMWGYSDTIRKEVIIWPTPKAKWNVFSTSKPNDVVTIDNVSEDADMYFWDLDDGEYDTTFVLGSKDKIFPNSDPTQIQKAVKLIAQNSYGCRDSVMENISVNPIVESRFLVDTISCSPLQKVAVSNSIGAVSYAWSLDGAPYESGDVRFVLNLMNNTDNTEKHTLSLRVKSVYGDESTSSKDLYVKPVPRAAFVTASSGVSPMELNLRNQSLGGDAFTWNMGTGDSLFASNLNDLNYIYENKTGAPLPYVISLLAENNEGCYDSIESNLIVYPEVVADFDCPLEGCPPLSISFVDKSVGALYYEWTIDGSETYYGQTLRYEFGNKTLVSKSYNVKLKVESAFGYIDSISKIITVKPFVSAAFEATSGEQAPFISEFTTQSINAATAQWNFGDLSGDVTLGGAANTTHLYENISEPTAFNSRLLVTSPQGCVDSANTTVMVYPPMEISFVCPEEGCSPFDVQFKNTSSGADIFEWNFGDGSSHWMSKDAYHRFENNTNLPITYTVILIGQSKYGFSDTVQCAVTILPRPRAQFNISSEGGSPFNALIQNISTDASVSTWTFSDGAFSSSASEFSHLFVNSTGAPVSENVVLMVQNTYACKDSSSKTVNVFPPVVADFDMTPEGCSPLSVPFSNNSEGALRYLWMFGDGSAPLESTTPVHVFENNSSDTVAVFNVTLVAVSQFGYADTLVKQVRVLPVPKAMFNLDKNSGCAPLTIGIDNNSVGDGTYMWHFNEQELLSSDAFISHTIENTNFLPSYTEVSLRITNAWGCQSEVLKVVEAFPQVIATFSGDSVGCSPFMASLSNISRNASDFYWEIDGIKDFRQHPLVQFDNTTGDVLMKEAILIASSGYGCADTTRKTLRVLPEPEVAFGISSDVGSSPFIVDFSDQSNYVTSYRWNFGDGDTLNSTTFSPLSHTYLNNELTPIGRKIELLGTNRFGCESKDARSISVFPYVNADFKAILEGCSPLVVDFENLSRGAIRFEWIFGDESPASVASNPSHVYESDDVENVREFTVKLVAFSQYGLTDTIEKLVKVHPTPKANFDLNVQAGCSPVDVVLKNKVMGSGDITWTIGTDLSFEGKDSLFAHTFINNGRVPVYQNVSIRVENQFGCVHETQKVVEVLPGVKAEFECDTMGCSPFIVVFKNKSFNASNYQWNFGDGELSQDNTPTYTYVNKSAVDFLPDVSLVASTSYGCRDTFVKQITVYPEPDFTFDVTPEELTMPLNEVTILPDIKNSGPWKFVWDFGDGTSVESEKPETHVYDRWGSYDISVRVYDARCSDVQYKGVVVNPAVPYAAFRAPASVCAPASVLFENLSEPGLTDLWDFGDGNFSSEESPVHNYFQPGAYNVSLMVFNEIGHSDTFTTVINVYKGVNADFLVTPQVLNSFSQEAKFTNFSENAAQYDWDFGDGDYSHDENPVKKYSEEGAFDISLIVISEDGCRDTMLQETAVRVSDVYSIQFPNAFIPSRGGGSGGGFVVGKAESNNVFYPILDYGNIKEYRLMIFNRWGLQVFESTDVYVGWDGYYRGELTPQGVYVWKVRALFFDGNEVVKAGDLTLIR